MDTRQHQLILRTCYALAIIAALLLPVGFVVQSGVLMTVFGLAALLAYALGWVYILTHPERRRILSLLLRLVLLGIVVFGLGVLLMLLLGSAGR